VVEPDVINRIRAIFLHPEPRVTVAEVAHMLGWSSGRMNEATRDGEIEIVATCDLPRQNRVHIRTVERGDQRACLALQRCRQTQQGHEIRDHYAALDLAHMTLRQSGALGDDYLRQPAPCAHLAHSRTQQFASPCPFRQSEGSY
jgi:hypothetical protein